MNDDWFYVVRVTLLLVMLTLMAAGVVGCATMTDTETLPISDTCATLNRIDAPGADPRAQLRELNGGRFVAGLEQRRVELERWAAGAWAAIEGCRRLPE